MKTVKLGLFAALLTATAGAFAGEPIYGICEHVACRGFDHDNCDREFAQIAKAGVTWVRTDFLWGICEPKDGEWDWSVFDDTVAKAEAHGLTLLPILCYDSPVRGKHAWEEPDRWCRFVRETVRRYRRSFRVVEVWNEPNIFFWKPHPDAAQYTALLKETYRVVKEEAPEIEVMIGGMAGVPLDYLEKVYAAGGKDFFDIMNVHPYSWPAPPDGRLDVELKGLKDLMAKHGDAAKPIWITEHGWPTHRVGLPERYAFLSGLAIARPGQERWRVAYAVTKKDDASAEGIAETIAETLGKGSTAKAYASAALRDALRGGELDAVVMPFDESFPYDALDAIVEFVAKGGVLVDFGGFPLFHPYTNGVYASATRNGAREGDEARSRLRVSVDAFWMNPDLPQTLQTFVTDRARAAGYIGELGGCDATRFFTAKLLKPGDEMIPLLVGKDKKGADAVGACVYRFGSDMTGAVVLSSRGHAAGTSTEAQQAANLVRSLEIVREFGVEAYFPYEFRAFENDPFYSEAHFGLVHRDLTPKPAWKAYAKAIADARRDDVQVAAYYFGNYHLDPRNEKRLGKGWSEWKLVRESKPRFEGHRQPKRPLWGETDEADPRAMAQKIDAAADYGVDAFIFDWYHYDDGPFLSRTIDEGYLKAPNNARVKFALMWANHDWVDLFPATKDGGRPLIYPGKVTPETFDRVCDHVIADYFCHPSYWKIDGRPYFSIYELTKFGESFGSYEATKRAIARFRAKVKAAGFPDVHLNAVYWGNPNIPGEGTVKDPVAFIEGLGFDSVTSYVWVHHVWLPKRETGYDWVRDSYLQHWDRAKKDFRLPYYPNVSMGWDASPRTAQDGPWDPSYGYPFSNVIVGNTPARFRRALKLARERLLSDPKGPRILNINSWNEWTEGSYIEPDVETGYGYLEAVRDVFGR